MVYEKNKIELFKNIQECQISGSKDLQLILSLGLIPLVNQMAKLDMPLQKQIFLPAEIFYSPISKL